MDRRRTLITIMLAAAVSSSPASPSLSAADAQTATESADDQRERGFVEALRREDPATADHYVKLRDARVHAESELRRIEGQYRAAGNELRGIFVAPLREAQRTYATISLALLDFLEARDRRAIERYREEIARINAALEQHKKIRDDLEKLLRGPQ